MKLLNKLFKTKVKELVDETKKVEELFDKLDEKISLLRSTDRRHLLKEELRRLIAQSKTLEYSRGHHSRYPSIYAEGDGLASIDKQIDELIAELK